MIPWRMRQVLARPGWALGRAMVDLRAPFVWPRRYHALREPKRIGHHEHTEADEAQVRSALARAGFDVRPLRVDLDAFMRFRERADYARFPLYLDGGRAPESHEKALEHYLAFELLRLGPQDVYVDIASQNSPVPDIYARLAGARVVRQDLVYPPGLHGDRIGGDAASLPVPDGFASGMALHNAFEHFEGDSDTRFVAEACRVLRPGGRLVILPLFLAPHYLVQTDPAVWPPGGIAFEPDAEVLCARGWRDRFGRHYDAAHLATRVAGALRGARLTVFRIENAAELHPGIYMRFAALVEREA